MQRNQGYETPIPFVRNPGICNVGNLGGSKIKLPVDKTIS